MLIRMEKYIPGLFDTKEPNLKLKVMRFVQHITVVLNFMYYKGLA